MAILASKLSGRVIANLEIDSADLTRYQVYESISLAQKELANILPTEFIQSLLLKAPADLTINQPYVDTPAEYLRFVALFLDYTAQITDTNPGVKARRYSKSDNFLAFSKSGTTTFPMYDLEGDFSTNDRILISPTPTATVTGGAEIWYIKVPDDVNATVDAEIHERFEDLIVSRATALSAMIEDYRPDMASQFQNFYLSSLSSYIPKDQLELIARTQAQRQSARNR